MRTKRILSILLSLVLVLGMLPGMSLTASAEGNTTEITPSNTSGTMTITLTIAEATHSVTITAGENMTTTGNASQNGLSGAMTDVVYTAADGYYFPTDYSVTAVNGISVTRNSYTQITVSGTPSADATITLTAPTAKTTPDAPATATATGCTTSDNNDGKLTGVTTAMEYKKSDADSWTAGTGNDITGLVPGTYYVRVKATDTANASANQELTIADYNTAAAKAVSDKIAALPAIDQIKVSDAKQITEAREAFDALIKAGIAHLWFVNIHPFDDGNGRLARTLTDMLLARADGLSQRFYSMSAAILRNKKGYYQMLEYTGKHGLDVTEWLTWFLQTLEEAIDTAREKTELVLKKTRFWQKHKNTVLNERQIKIINRLWEGFEGKLNTSKWAKITKTSKATALRDIQDLESKGILHKCAEAGRSTNYELIEE